MISCNKEKCEFTDYLDNKIKDKTLDMNLNISYDHISLDEHINLDVLCNMDDLNYDIIKNNTQKRDVPIEEYTLNDDKRDIMSTINNEEKLAENCGFVFLNNEHTKGDKSFDGNNKSFDGNNKTSYCNNKTFDSINPFYNKETPFFLDTIKNFKEDLLYKKMFENVSRKGLIFILTIQDVLIKKTKKILCNKCSEEIPSFNNINNILKDMLKINIEKQTSEIYMTKLLKKIKVDFLKTQEYLTKEIKDKIHIINNLNIKNELLNNIIKKYKEYFYKIKNEEEIKNSRIKINIHKQFLHVTDFLYHLILHIYTKFTEKNNKLKFLICQMKKLKLYDEQNENVQKNKKKNKNNKILKNKTKMEMKRKKVDHNHLSNVNVKNENNNKYDFNKNNKKKIYNNPKYGHHHSDNNTNLNIKNTFNNKKKNTQNLLLSKKSFSDVDNNKTQSSSLNSSSSTFLSNELCLSDFTHMNTNKNLTKRNKNKMTKLNK
ncbi:hypothetical protein PFMALIP_02432 [Plasmodium falciparum MaliPS096_E11]|uniref:Uncharacterized protein n=1 Tax=Plasmodium falciparum MaliPS096_E11 TaxID=1036727 RepID=A0A024WQK2_PLAFA|nr:hypothetical protein PFMALIP_02432 [Plasmodium falciparum MaliPS096_E11]